MLWSERQFMRSIKGSLVGVVLAGILALAPTAAFAHGGGGGGHGGGFGGGGHFGGGSHFGGGGHFGGGRAFAGRGFHDGFHHHDFRRDHDRFFFGTGFGFYPPSGYLDYPDYGYYDYDTSDYSETIVAVQKELAKLGYYNGPIDGTVGPQTETAIRWFQSVEKLPVTGQIDDPTLQALRIS